jgi:hypothetical protein
MRLTAAALGGLKLDGVTDRIIFDDDIPGFGRPPYPSRH